MRFIVQYKAITLEFTHEIKKKTNVTVLLKFLVN